jgi:hypothetical protein
LKVIHHCWCRNKLTIRKIRVFHGVWIDHPSGFGFGIGFTSVKRCQNRPMMQQLRVQCSGSGTTASNCHYVFPTAYHIYMANFFSMSSSYFSSHGKTYCLRKCVFLATLHSPFFLSSSAPVSTTLLFTRKFSPSHTIQTKCSQMLPSRYPLNNLSLPNHSNGHS